MEQGEPETDDERTERLRIEKESKMTYEELHTIPVVGSFPLFLTRLDEEYVKSLQRTSPHTPDYVARLRDETKLVALLGNARAYLQRVGQQSDAAELALLQAEHLYYRHDTIAEQVDRAAAFHMTYGEATELHPACVGTEGGKGQTDYAMFHPASTGGRPAVAEPEADTAQSRTVLCLCSHPPFEWNRVSQRRTMSAQSAFGLRKSPK